MTLDVGAAPREIPTERDPLSIEESELVVRLCRQQRSKLPSYLLSAQAERLLLDEIIQKLE